MTSGFFSLPRVNRASDGWSSRSLRSMLVARSERNRADLPLLTVARERGVFVRSVDDANHNTIPEDLSNYKVAHAGDLVINKMKAWQGSLGLAPVDGIVSPAYFVFAADFAVPRFGEYLLRSKPYVAKFGAASDGVRIGQWDLNIPRMRNIEVLLPPAKKQAAIVRYLAHANARIDKAIVAKRRLIALLEEQRDVTVRAILSRGLDSRPPSKLVATGRLCRIDTGVEDSGNAEPSGKYPFFVRGREVLRASDYHFDAEAVLTPGDGQGGTGKVFHYYNGKFQAHQRVYVFSQFSGIIARYFYWYMTAFFREHALAQSNTVTMESLRRPVLASFRVAVHDEDVQRMLVERIEARVADTAQVIEKTRREITLLHEFRTRLVADVVTGQVDVRSIVATLPDAPEATAELAADSDDEFGDLQEEGL